MKPKTKIAMENLMVKNPFTGLQTDVLPIFDAMNSFFSAYRENDERLSDIDCTVKACQEIMDYVIHVTSICDYDVECTDFTPILIGLTELRNMFKAMKELK